MNELPCILFLVRNIEQTALTMKQSPMGHTTEETGLSFLNGHLLPKVPWVGRGRRSPSPILVEVLIDPVWDLCGQPQLLWAHKCKVLVMSRRYYFPAFLSNSGFQSLPFLPSLLPGIKGKSFLFWTSKSYYIILVCLKLTMQIMLVSDSQGSTCLCLLCARIKGCASTPCPKLNF